MRKAALSSCRDFTTQVIVFTVFTTYAQPVHNVHNLH